MRGSSKGANQTGAFAHRGRLDCRAHEDPSASLSPGAMALTASAYRTHAKTLARYATFALPLGLTAYLFALFARRLMHGPLGYDEQFFAWGGWSILKGLAPYKDFLEYKPPMLFVTHALGLKLFGLAGQKFRLFFWTLSLSGVLGFQLALLVRGGGRLVTCALGVALVHLFVNSGYHDTSLADAESVGLSYYLLGAAFLVADGKHRRLTQIAGGAFMACCGLSKEPFIPCVVATWATCFFLENETLAFRERLIRYLKNTTIGVLIVFVGLSLYMVPTGAMKAYVTTLIGYRQMFRDPAKSYCVLLGRFRPTGSFWGDVPAQWDVINNSFFNVQTLGFLAPFFAASIVFAWRRSVALFAACVMTMLAALYSVTASNCYWPHYYVMLQSGMFFVLGVGALTLSWRLRRAGTAVSIWAQLACALAVLVPVYPRYEAEKAAVYTPMETREPIAGVYDFVRKHTTPNDRIFTTGAPGLYMLTNRIQAVRESSIIDELIETMPGNTDEEKLRPLYDQLMQNKPKVVILDPEHGHRKRRHMAAAIQPYLDRMQYQKVSEYFYLLP